MWIVQAQSALSAMTAPTAVAASDGVGIVETWQIVATLLLSVGGLLTPIVLAAMARDKSLMSMISGAKEDMAAHINAATAPLHERVNRVRDEYVRRDDLDGHLRRFEKSMDEVKSQLMRQSEKTEARLSEIAALIRRNATS